MSYSKARFLEHLGGALEDSIGWPDATGQFHTDREREAYRAGFTRGGHEALRILTAKAGVDLESANK